MFGVARDQTAKIRVYVAAARSRIGGSTGMVPEPSGQGPPEPDGPPSPDYRRALADPDNAELCSKRWT